MKKSLSNNKYISVNYRLVQSGKTQEIEGRGRKHNFISQSIFFSVFLRLSAQKGVPLHPYNSSFHCKNHRMAIINRIKAVLAEKQLTSKWLAERLEKSENTVSKWCSNKVQPSLENLIEIAKILDIDVRDLLVSTK